MSKKKGILGIDPGLNNIGLGFIPLKKQLQGKDIITALISPPSKVSLISKLQYNARALRAFLKDLQADYSIEKVVIEKPSHHYARGRKVNIGRAYTSYVIATGLIIGVLFAFKTGFEDKVILYNAPSGKSGLKTKNKAMFYLAQVIPDVNWVNYSDHERDALILALHFRGEKNEKGSNVY